MIRSNPRNWSWIAVLLDGQYSYKCVCVYLMTVICKLRNLGFLYLWVQFRQFRSETWALWSWKFSTLIVEECSTILSPVIRTRSLCWVSLLRLSSDEAWANASITWESVITFAGAGTSLASAGCSSSFAQESLQPLMLDHVYSSQKVSCSWPCMRLVSGNESIDKLSVESHFFWGKVFSILLCARINILQSCEVETVWRNLGLLTFKMSFLDPKEVLSTIFRAI